MIEKLKKELREYFVGNEETAENMIVCLLAGGHVLLEDVPGVGKTTLAKTLSRLIDCDFGRIQFTPDTLPTDVTGTEIYNMKTGEFEYREGAVMHQVILADEINRTSPKTQASLLEAMAEGQVTVGGKSYPLKSPFMVIATQNPVEFFGTYPLPEAQMDRFMMRLSLGYPSRDEELRMAKNALDGKDPATVKSICTTDDIIKLREMAEKIHVSNGVLEYIQEIISLTRKDSLIMLGASPRALLSLLRASQARAMVKGRDFVKPDDVRAVAVFVLHHRVTLTDEARLKKENIDKVLERLILKAKVPME